ncbi:bifunctional serine/threonine-protein kinase/formylglycine-generating enzyme family protein [Microbulbifer variabilis]|uniref:bifunctional serine/threonine-protein kinase/formylglycine-generating enzyme family protein n=1 Tax=Microbulbifer variabilis TaxID=266805 RepID=UPI001CFE8738|nr:bifunctional serine/threonine-protein kinase/formylglycine-generating enzyme family protein [Microbulbifer variabilis]
MELVKSGNSTLQIPGYRILRKINQGGMSTVYLAIQRSVGRQVALKVMSPVLNADPIFSERFQREANIVGQLSHPNIVGIHDIGRYRSLNYIAMDYLSGGSVAERLAKGPLDPLEALNVVRQIAMALDHSHSKGYVHRDLKPENILFREDGSAVLSDFGVARAVAHTTRMTNSGMVVGTPHYMSPEQARGNAIDGRADLYSLGVVFYEMLAGVVPYQAEEAVAIAIKHLTDPIPKLPARHALYQSIIDRALAKDPTKRFQRGLEVADAADQLVATLAGKPSQQISQLNNTSVSVSSLARALFLTLLSSLRESFLKAWQIRQGNPQQLEPARKDQDTLVRLRQLVSEPAKHKRPWAFSAITAITLVLGWSVFSLLSNKETQLSNITLADDANALHTNPISRTDSVDKKQTAITDATSEKLPKQVLELASPQAISLGNSLKLPQSRQPAQLPVTANLPTQTSADTSEKLTNAIPTFKFTVATEPEDARIRIMNIAPRYQPGIRLEPGQYDVEVSKPGYSHYRHWISIEDQDLQFSVKLQRAYFAGKKIRSELSSGGRGPQMIVVDSGEFTMGSDKHSNSRPTHEVNIPKAFAISTREITFEEFDRFVLATGAKQPSDAGWGRGERPAINISWQDAQDYVQWLSEETGRKYRLPTEAEWEYAARSGTEHSFWWKSSDARGKANCRRGCDSQFNSLFSTKTGPVANYQANPFGLYDTAGNVAEWVQDCYQPGYDKNRNTSSPVKLKNCQLRSVRGGSMRDPSNRIGAEYRKGLDENSRTKDVGMRVVMELD